METPLLQGLGLHKAFGPDQALAGAGLTLEAGEIVAIMGPSGSGKSTLLHCLSGILRPDRGEVLFRGRELANMTDSERSALRRTEFGFVFQFGQLVPELTCLENVALPLRLGGMKRRPAERLARDWLDRLEVGDSDDSTPGQVSGGQSQRVAMARALITEPSVIFADEPTGALDTLSGERVMRLLSETAKQTDAAVVLVTHEPRVAAYSDREVIVRDGRTREPVVTR
ncbi:ABC transporter ATP-binding protein [Amycolatopsis sp. BJA-103]|uniref:ABC transporter ATP-binding protein n=1 Tax=Amycolatopsis sp. BJA-103 TaxID=1911175 RepID=UPI000C783453|nr:ABC transporter ATP-binding protein [Amycolatopsis sp. BJA-103]AUI63674.1 macrolide ABC transporter ATP-binding protein [Amycolatopsis sp. BJA-103]PNE19518.1 macrolide ABC transporter ATP-binding protein [Amycolatopsis sp. BJA-103]